MVLVKLEPMLEYPRRYCLVVALEKYVVTFIWTPQVTTAFMRYGRNI